MPENRLFVETDALDRWVASGRMELSGNSLTVIATGERYRLDEAVHVVKDATGSGDAHTLVGLVRTVADLSALGAEVLGSSLVLGESAYDGTPGFVLVPLGRSASRLSTAAAVRELAGLSAAAASVQSDEALLARYLIDKLE